MKGEPYERALVLANYIIEQNATVRQTAKVFDISKSTVQTVLIIGVGCIGCLNMRLKS